MDVGGEHEPRPAVGLFGVAHAQRVSAEGLLNEAEGVLQVEAPDGGTPEQVEIEGVAIGGVQPVPEDLRGRGSPGQAADLDEHKGHRHDGRRTRGTVPGVVLQLRV